MTEVDPIQFAREVLRAKELRATPARIAVLNLVAGSEQPISHQEAADELAKGGYDKSTIFRALVDLTDASLLRKFDAGDHVWRFERVQSGDDSHPVHPHLMCVDCGNIQCLDEGQVELKASKTFGKIEDVIIKGHCKDCQ
jgi:Fur family transcriptional regulator, ferric uptake regulator